MGCAQVDFIKVDTEGAELLVLKGTGRTHARTRTGTHERARTHTRIARLPPVAASARKPHPTGWLRSP
jgi:hypothetical protein